MRRKNAFSITALVLAFAMLFSSCSKSTVHVSDSASNGSGGNEKDIDGVYGTDSKGSEYVEDSEHGTDEGRTADDYEVVKTWAGLKEGASFQTLYEGACNRMFLSFSVIWCAPTFRLDTKKELDGFVSDYQEVLQLDTEKHGLPSFSEATEKYDDEFFSDNSLVVVYIHVGKDDTCGYTVDHIGKDKYDQPNVGNCWIVDILRSPMDNPVKEEEMGFLFVISVSDEELKSYIDMYHESKGLAGTDDSGKDGITGIIIDMTQ